MQLRVLSESIREALKLKRKKKVDISNASLSVNRQEQRNATFTEEKNRLNLKQPEFSNKRWGGGVAFRRNRIISRTEYRTFVEVFSTV